MTGRIPAGEWEMAKPGWKYEFPRDHGRHPSFKTEWWYFTGNLLTVDGKEFGYQLTFFRQGVIPPDQPVPSSGWIRRDVPFAHFAVSRISENKFHHFERLVRGGFGEAGFEDGSRLAWIGNWECTRTGPHDFRLRASEGDIRIDLKLTAEKLPVAHGLNGASRKSDAEGGASHYYSLTRMTTAGTIQTGTSSVAVTGSSWFDHEWASNQLTTEQVGWDWFSLQMDDGSELMLFQIRRKDGTTDPSSSGTFVRADGTSSHIPYGSFRLEPVSTWQSLASSGRYPVKWKVIIPNLNLELMVVARLENQELQGEPFTYWEGAVTAKGTMGGIGTTAKGYLEMTGYGGPIRGLNGR